MHKLRVEVLSQKSEVISLKNQAKYIFIVGQLRAWEIMKNIKRCTSPIKLPFLVFQNLTLDFSRPLKQKVFYNLNFLYFSTPNSVWSWTIPVPELAFLHAACGG